MSRGHHQPFKVAAEALQLDEFGPVLTYKTSIATANEVAQMKTKTRRHLFLWMRTFNGQMDSQKFFPTLGMTAGQIATYIVISDSNHRLKAAATSRRNQNLDGKTKAGSTANSVNGLARTHRPQDAATAAPTRNSRPAGAQKRRKVPAPQRQTAQRHFKDNAKLQPIESNRRLVDFLHSLDAQAADGDVQTGGHLGAPDI